MRWMRLRLSLVLLAVIAFFCGKAGATLADEADAPRPNIIFIMADDLGYGDLGCYGQEKIATPNLDRMASDGLRFTRAYSGSTVCAPARSVLMTGQHTGHTLIRGNMGREGHGAVRGIGTGALRVPLRPEDVTVAEVLKSAGYATGIVGKWGLGEPDTTGHPNRKGFDEWFGYLNQNRAHNHYPDFIWINDHKYPLVGNRDGRHQQYTHHLFTEYATQFITRHAGGDEPFFLYLPYTVPHARMQAPDFGPYADEDWPEPLKAYAAMVYYLDRDVGRILDLLEALEIDDNTLVIFTSDNGPHAEGGNDPTFFNSSGPLRGMKRDMTEGGIRVPFIARWPGVVPAGQTSDTPIYFADMLPTFTELAGASSPDAIDGHALVPTLRGESQPQLRERYMYWEFHERGFDQAAIRGDWKVIRNGHDGPLQLYNVADDPGEQHDLAADHPDRVEQFEQYLQSARTPSANWPTPLD